MQGCQSYRTTPALPDFGQVSSLAAAVAAALESCCLASSLLSSSLSLALHLTPHTARRTLPPSKASPPLLRTLLHREPPMYITSDLFGGASAQSHRGTTLSTHWNNMPDAEPAAGLGKRKRHDNGEEGPNTYDSLWASRDDNTTDDRSSCSHHHRPQHASRGFDRLQSHNPHYDPHHNLSYAIYPAPPPTQALAERRPVKQLKRFSSPKASLLKSTSHLMEIENEPPSHLPHPPYPVSDTRPCHACKSAPKRKRDLENYLDCKRCVERTCYICARVCFGGCGRTVCNTCIVEVGEEGDPWCLDCYARKLNS
jgi:hypothetical protein